MTLEELDRRMRELAELAADTDGLSREEVRAELRAARIELAELAASILAEARALVRDGGGHGPG